jgi:hypothetical protein
MPDNSRMDPQGFSDDKSRLRASDADRDRAASLINTAMAEGRLTADEHSERLDAIYSAKTHAELVPLLDDLPGHSAAVADIPDSSAAVAPAKSSDRIIAILGGATRKGTWHPGPIVDIVTVLGGAELDFREAVLPRHEVTIRITCVLGGLSITVPPEMQVINSTVNILGGTETDDGDETAPHDGAVLRITGTCVLGGVEIKRRARKPRKGFRGVIQS